MKQSVIIHKILNLNKSLHQLNANNKHLTSHLKNPAFDYLQTKIMLKHASINEYFAAYSGMMLYSIENSEPNTLQLTSKEQRLRQHERLLINLKNDAIIIESNIESSEKFKQVFSKLYKLCTKQLEVIQKEISLLLNIYSNEFSQNQHQEATIH